MPIRTSVANASTISGYIIAPFTRRLICVSFSIWKATRSSTTSRIPAASPASTIETKRREKIFGWRAIASERRRPPSTSARTSAMTVGELLVLGLLLEDDERRDDVQAGLDHRRELAREDLQRLRLDLLDRAARGLAEPPARGGSSARRPRTRSASRAAAQVGRVDLARELDALGVDGRVRERGHSARNRHHPARLEGRAALADEHRRRTPSCHRPPAALPGQGFGMIELIAAMMVMAIGVLAVFAMYHSSMTQLRRASTVTTAAGARGHRDGEVPRARVRVDRSWPRATSARPTRPTPARAAAPTSRSPRRRTRSTRPSS